MIVPCGLGDLLQHALEPFLELAAVGGAGDQRAHVECDHAAVAQRLGHVPGDDPLGEALDDRGLADAGLADQHGVVLGAPREHLDHATDLLVAPDHRVELALLGDLGQVAPEALERALLLLGGLRGGVSWVGCHRASSRRDWPAKRGDRRCAGTASGRRRRARSARRGRGRARRGRSDAPARALRRAHLRRAAPATSSSSMRACISSICSSSVEHPLDASEVEAELGGHLLDAAQPLDVLLRVQARALGRALGLDQAARLVHAQRLRVHARRARRRRRS